jgi:hypothetical protein
MARRILNRKELRANYDAAESRKKEDGETDELEEEEEEGDEAPAAGEEGESGEEEAPKKKKPAKAPKPRSRAAKVTRLKAVWGVFNNSNQRVAVFDYPKRREAEEMAAKLTADKKSTHFIQMQKEPIEEKKDA